MCMVCERLNSGENWVIVIRDDKDKIQVNCHRECADELEQRLKKIKDLDKKNVKQVLKQIKLKLEV